MSLMSISVSFFFFNDTAPTEIYTLSLHDALPIYPGRDRRADHLVQSVNRILILDYGSQFTQLIARDRKSTRLNSSHVRISYAVFCLEKKTSNDLARRHSLLMIEFTFLISGSLNE